MEYNFRKIERVVKGFSNHWRLRIIELLKRQPELYVAEIAELLNGDFKNISAHLGKLAIAGIVIKRNEGNIIRHKLTTRGDAILKFVRIIE